MTVQCMRCGWRGEDDEFEGHACQWCGDLCTEEHRCEEADAEEAWPVMGSRR